MMRIKEPNTNADGTIRGKWHLSQIMAWANEGTWFRVCDPFRLATQPRYHMLCCHVSNGPTMIGCRGWWGGDDGGLLLSICDFYEPGTAPWWTNQDIPMNRLLAEIDAETLKEISVSRKAWLQGWERKLRPVPWTMPKERGLRITSRNRDEDVLMVPAA